MKKKPDIREKVMSNGLCYPTNKELIMLLLGSGQKGKPVNVLANKVLDKIMSCEENKLIDELLKIDGIGPSKAILVGAALELGRRYNLHRGKLILEASDIIPYVKHYAMYQQEHFISITLNGAHEIIRIVPVSVGTLNKAMVHPRDVFSSAIKDMAASIIVCHNHPSGNSYPSAEDFEVTERLIKAGECLGIKIIDHLILTQNNYFSFNEQGYI